MDFNGFYIVRTEEDQPRPKCIFKTCGRFDYYNIENLGFSCEHISYFFQNPYSRKIIVLLTFGQFLEQGNLT